MNADNKLWRQRAHPRASAFTRGWFISAHIYGVHLTTCSR